MPVRTCSDCQEEKDEASCFEYMHTGKYRNQCKKCKSARRRRSANSDAAKKKKTENRKKVPPPTECAECHKGPTEVNFKWREDTNVGGWRGVCDTCVGGKKYNAAYRERKLEEDPDAFRAHNTRMHRLWVRENPHRMKEYHMLERTVPDRKFKRLLTYVRAKNKKNDEGEDSLSTEETEDEDEDDDSDSRQQRHRNPLRVCMDDADILKARFSMPCHYCGHVLAPGSVLNCLDRIDTNGHYDTGNTVPACCACNKMRGCMSIDEFIDNVRRIHDNNHDHDHDYDHGETSRSADPVSTNMREGEGQSEPTLRLTFGGTAKRRAAHKKKKKDMLTLDEKIDLWSAPCYLCDRLPALGIDRVNSSDDYIVSSCRPCCSVYCNYMKCDWELADFLAHIRRVYLHTMHWVLRDITSFPIRGNTERARVPVMCVSVYPTAAFVVFSSMWVASTVMGVHIDAITEAVENGTQVKGMTWRTVGRAEFEHTTRGTCHDTASCLRRVITRARQ